MTTAAELKLLLRSFNAGVRGVRIEEGIVCVDVTNQRTALGVTCDLLRSGGFRSVNTVPNNFHGGLTVNACPKV